ncbi:uncharacterized protein LOC143179303 [Calliopsis andreniformis]|uniref:uncharacterized protein LOC143179303 n=1 Tax=Calliopsis andreniformis TaxID=337506 RepID=UPI003FCC99CE
MFPVPDDPGLVPAFWTLYETQDAYDDDGIRKFFDLTKKLNIKPIQTVKNMLLTDTINLQYYGVNPKVIKPLCEALMNNIFVTTVNLTENWLSEDACYHLGDLLLRNNNIHTLLLAGCRIGAKGAAKLKKGIAQSTALITLDLSSCEIHKEGLEHITEAACNTELETLCLNDNHLDETCADAVRDLILCSSTLKKLELAWNSLYTVETWRKLGRALEENEVLLELDLSWNALGRECIPFLRQFLMRAQSLKKLDLSGNRFYNEDAMNIARGLSRNQSLHELYVGNNPFKAEGALALVQAVTPENSPESQLRLLDLTNIWASKSILPDLETIKNDRPWLDIKLGGILSNYKIEGPNVPAILFKRAIYEAMKPKNKRRRRNFGHFVLSLSDNPISRGIFTELVKQFGLKLSPTLVKEIMHAFPGPRHVVDQALLRAAYLKLYPDTKPPPERPIKQKKGKGKKKKT